MSDTVGQLASLATTAPSVLNGSPVAAPGQPKPQPQSRLQATDSAVLWMVELFDTGKSIESSIGSLAHKQRSGLIANATISVFDEEDDWVAEAVPN